MNIGATETRAELIDMVQRAEADGYGVVIAPDHISTRHGVLPLLMAAADLAPTIRVSPMVIANDYRNPAVLARECATIDVLSGGRFELGLGTGWIADQYRAAGIAYDSPGVRVDRLEEAIEVLKGCWSGEPFTFAGSHYQTIGVTCPKPAQSPRPPLLIAGAGPRILGIAGREADIVNLSPVPVGSSGFEAVAHGPAATGDLLETQLGWIHSAAGERVGEIELSVSIQHLIVTDDTAVVIDEMTHETGASAAQIRRSPHVLIGSTDEVIATLQRRREEYGISYVLFGHRHLDAAGPIVSALAGT
jgi:probable F420-dependent oxidoreductase